MKSISGTKMRAIAWGLTLATIAATTAGCEVGLVGESPAYYDDYPPDAYIATTEPVYFEGHASYWYGGRWYYREARSWRHYDREPTALYQHRSQAAPRRHNYEPSRARGVGRAGWRTRGHR